MHTSPGKFCPVAHRLTALLLSHKDDHSHSSALTEKLRHCNIFVACTVLKPGQYNLIDSFSQDSFPAKSGAVPPWAHEQCRACSIVLSDIDLKWSLFQECFYKEELKDNTYWPALQLVAWWQCLTKCQRAPLLQTVLRDIGSNIDHSNISWRETFLRMHEILKMAVFEIFVRWNYNAFKKSLPE